jgi:serine/threonine-protein kinase
MMRTSSCPEAGRLCDLLDGMLSDPEQAELTGHLDHCPRCQQQLDTLATGGLNWTGVTRLGRWRSEAGPGLGRIMAELTGTTLETPPDPLTIEEPILGYLAPSTHPAALGRFGPYEVLEVLGQGGMGVVLRALDPGLNRVVAIKVLAPQLAASGAARKRFAREAKAAAAVVHEHVVAIHAVDVAHGLPYLVSSDSPRPGSSTRTGRRPSGREASKHPAGERRA